MSPRFDFVAHGVGQCFNRVTGLFDERGHFTSAERVSAPWRLAQPSNALWQRLNVDAEDALVRRQS